MQKTFTSTSWESSVIKAPISRVWAVVRPVDFRYLGKRIKDVSLEGKVSPSAVGGIRKVEYADRDKTVQTILLLELSDSAHTVSWQLISSTPEPEKLGFSSSVHTVKLKRVTDGDATFVEWTTEFSRDVTEDVMQDASWKARENLTAIANHLAESSASGSSTSGVETKSELKAPKLQRQLSLNSKSLLQKAFDKLDAKSSGVIDRDSAVDYFQKVCKKADVQRERASMVLSDFVEPKIDFDTFAAFFKSVQLPDQRLESVLESLGFD